VDFAIQYDTPSKCTAWLSFPLKPVAHAAYALLKTGQRTTKEWDTAVDQLITSNGVGTTFSNFGGGGGPL
jgi:hypothetical protein